MLSLFSIAETPLALDVPMDPEVLARVSGFDRIGALRPSHILEVKALSYLADQEDSAAMESLGVVLRESIARRVHLWLGLVDVATVDHIQEVLGDACQVAGPARPVPENWKLRLPAAKSVVPLAVSPQAFLHHCLQEGSGLRGFALHNLEGMDTARVPGRGMEVLRKGGVKVRERSLAFRLAHSPVIWTYILVMLYSVCRALPVAFIPHFHGNIWVLWALDVLGAIPYTWGVIAMFTAKKALVRVLALAVALITFIAPYVYFWSHGHHYPFQVNLVIAGFIASAVGFEVVRYLRERRVRARVSQG